MSGRADAPVVRTHTLPTGPLAVATWSGASDPVLAVHGISSNNRLWLWLADAAPGLTLVAPDLPGRGDSPPVGGPSSMATRADHLVELMDDLGFERMHVLGMSLGGFVSSALAARHPDRVRTITLVDGGLPMATIVQDREAMGARLRSQYGDSTAWPSSAAYAREYAANVAPLVDPTDPHLADFLGHHLEHDAAGGRTRLDLDSVVDDGVDVFCTDSAAGHFAAVQAPVRLVWAPWGVGPGSAPMYAADHVQRCTQDHPALRSAELVPDVDHAAIVMTSRGAQACARALEANLAS